MIKNKNKTRIIALLLTIALLIPRYVEAAGPSGNGGGGPAPGPASSGGGGGCGDTAPSCSYGLNWTWKISARSKIYAPTTGTVAKYIGDGYDPDTLADKYFTAGRYIGIDDYEEIEYKINITNVSRVKGVDRSWNSWTGCNIPVSYNPSNSTASKPSTLSYQCSSTETTNQISKQLRPVPGDFPDDPVPTPEPVPDCECVVIGSIEPNFDQRYCFNEAYNIAVNSLGLNATNNGVEPMYYAKRRNVNYINITDPVSVDEITTSHYEYTSPDTSEKITGMNSNILNSISNLTVTVKIRIKYNLGHACINVKTGIVEYKDTCNANELSVPDIYSKDVTGLTDAEKALYRIGQYFIPLDTKSTSDYTYSLKARRKDSKAICESYIENAFKKGKGMAEVRNTIMYVNSRGKATAFPANVTTEKGAKDLVTNGCYLSTTTHFKVKQEFYNQNSSNKLEGYGFFYRPIDPSNPFPNGLDDSTYWGQDGLYDKEKNSVSIDGKTNDLDDSFKSVTYTSTVTNPYTIRKYNVDHDLYMSWDNMNINGTSQFINDGYVTRNGGKNFYRLGCGPENSHWKECK